MMTHRDLPSILQLADEERKRRSENFEPALNLEPCGCRTLGCEECDAAAERHDGPVQPEPLRLSEPGDREQATVTRAVFGAAYKAALEQAGHLSMYQFRSSVCVYLRLAQEAGIDPYSALVEEPK